MKKVSVVTPVYNEEHNVLEVSNRTRAIFADGRYDYEHLFIDNASTDKTLALLRELAAKDKHVKVIANARNFGQHRSPIHALLQTTGDCAVIVAADSQDPPEVILKFLEKWEEGNQLVVGVKTQSEENPLVFAVRKFYYQLIYRMSEIELVRNFHGFSLLDRVVIEAIRKIDDPHPYFRGLLSEIGFKPAIVHYTQSARKKGRSKNGFYTLYDTALLGVTTHSKIPLRMMLMLGFAMSVVSFLLALGYCIAKLLYWNRFSFGMAPILVGLFFFSSLQLFFLGVIGEYLLAIHTQVFRRPLVTEKERIGF